MTLETCLQVNKDPSRDLPLNASLEPIELKLDKSLATISEEPCLLFSAEYRGMGSLGGGGLWPN